jgi:hypothetical protein
MNRLALTRRLPHMLGIALRLRDAGADDTCIAAALDIEPAGVGPLLEVAEAKLRRLAAANPVSQPGACSPDKDPAHGQAKVE